MAAAEYGTTPPPYAHATVTTHTPHWYVQMQPPLAASPAPSSSSDAARSVSSGSRTVRMSVLLNPSDEEEPDAEQVERRDASDTPAQPPAKVPKKRGRKAILPKMTNSERGKYYRAKRQAYSTDLALEVHALQSTISRLVALRGIRNELAVCPRNTTGGSLVRLVREYFKQFRYGVQLPPSQRNMLLQDVQTSTTAQEVFMDATMDPEVAFGEFKGIGVVLDQWTRYSKFHAFLHFELLEVRVNDNSEGHIVETVGRLRTKYSRRTIENVFPHVVGNETLIQRLIGKEVVYPCRNQFYFDRHGRIERYDVEADFPEALQQAIGNLEDVATLLGQALIRQQHMMGELDGEELAVIEKLERQAGDESPGSSTRGSPSRVMEVDFLLSDENPDSDVEAVRY